MASEIKLYNQDCMEAMKQMPDKAFDLAIVDPPYGVNFEYGQYKDTLENFKHIAEIIIPELVRVCGKVVVWSNHRNLRYLPPWDWLFCHAWRTTSSFGHLGYCQWQPMAYYGPHEKIGKNNNVLVSDLYIFGGNDNAIKEQAKFHPCPKPISVYHKILNRFLKEGDKVIDPFLGSASSAIACYDMGYDLTGFEIDKDYYGAAVKRLENHQKQLIFI